MDKLINNDSSIFYQFKFVYIHPFAISSLSLVYCFSCSIVLLAHFVISFGLGPLNFFSSNRHLSPLAPLLRFTKHTPQPSHLLSSLMFVLLSSSSYFLIPHLVAFFPIVRYSPSLGITYSDR